MSCVLYILRPLQHLFGAAAFLELLIRNFLTMMANLETSAIHSNTKWDIEKIHF